jgi:hypothetical protein
MDASTERFPRDNRSTPRHDFRGTLRAWIWKSRLPDLSAKSINVSERGIVTDKPFQKGEAVDCSCVCPKKSLENRQPSGGAQGS